jgi:hypothetical protein
VVAGIADDEEVREEAVTGFVVDRFGGVGVGAAVGAEAVVRAACTALVQPAIPQPRPGIRLG